LHAAYPLLLIYLNTGFSTPGMLAP